MLVRRILLPALIPAFCFCGAQRGSADTRSLKIQFSECGEFVGRGPADDNFSILSVRGVYAAARMIVLFNRQH